MAAAQIRAASPATARRRLGQIGQASASPRLRGPRPCPISCPASVPAFVGFPAASGVQAAPRCGCAASRPPVRQLSSVEASGGDTLRPLERPAGVPAGRAAPAVALVASPPLGAKAPPRGGSWSRLAAAPLALAPTGPQRYPTPDKRTHSRRGAPLKCCAMRAKANSLHALACSLLRCDHDATTRFRGRARHQIPRPSREDKGQQARTHLHRHPKTHSRRRGLRHRNNGARRALPRRSRNAARKRGGEILDPQRQAQQRAAAYRSGA